LLVAAAAAVAVADVDGVLNTRTYQPGSLLAKSLVIVGNVLESG